MLVSFPDPTLRDTPIPPGKGLEDRLGVTRISGKYGIQLKFRNARVHTSPFLQAQKDLVDTGHGCCFAYLQALWKRH